MASPSRGAIESGRILEQRATAASTGIVLVTSSFSRLDASMRSRAGPERTGWTPAANTRLAPPARSAASGLDERPGGVDDVVQDQHVTAFDLADDVQDLGLVLARPPLVDDRERGVEAFADGPRPCDPTHVRRNDHDVVDLELADRLEQDRRREQVVDRDVEEPLNLRRVQVHRQDPVGAGGRQEVGHQLGGDRHPRLVLLVLPPVAEVRHHGRDARGRGPAEGVQQDQQLHDVVVDRAAGRLHDEDVGAAHVLVDLAVVLPVGEVVERQLAQGDLQVVADFPREGRMGAAGEDLQLAVGKVRDQAGGS